MYIKYYKSAVGVLEIMANETAITRITYVEEIKEDHLNDVIQECSRQLDEYFGGTRTTFHIPIMPCGTSFQLRVWEALQSIPYGTTCSYKDIAIQIGNEKACRAVGMANNKNPIPIIIPCHRVIGKSGKLVGYAGGLDTKAYLLRHEERIVNIKKK